MIEKPNWLAKLEGIEKLCPKVLHYCPIKCDSSKQYNLEEVSVEV